MQLARVVVASFVSLGSLLGAAYFAIRTLQSSGEPTSPRRLITALISVEGRQLVDASDPDVPPGGVIVGIPNKELVIRSTRINIG